MFDTIPFLPARRVTIVGDSNCFLFGSRVIDMPEYFARPIVLNTHGFSGLSVAQSMIEGKLHPAIAGALAGYGGSQGIGKMELHEELNARRGYPVLVPRADSMLGEDASVVFIILGMVDFFHIVAEIGPLSDFYLDDPRFHADRFPTFPELPLTPRSVVDEVVARRLGALVPLLSAIRDLGVNHVYFHSVHPPTTDDDANWRRVAVNSIARVRYKVAILMNREFARVAKEHGFDLIDPWDDFTESGVLSDRFVLDGMHLNVAAARISATRLLQQVVRNRG